MTNMGNFPTRLRPELANRLREFSSQNDMPESIVVRLALRHFFDCEFGFPKMCQMQTREDDPRGQRPRGTRKIRWEKTQLGCILE